MASVPRGSVVRQEFTKATKLAAFQRAAGHCENPQCGQKLFTGNVEYHHDVECAFGGTADLGNCVCLCRGCHRAITNKQAKVIAKTTRIRNRHIGIKKPKTFRGWRRMNGELVLAHNK